MNFDHKWDAFYIKFFSEKTKKKSEKIILKIAIASFFIHLSIILLVEYGLLNLDASSELLKSPIAAIYTPFSFILVDEVYLLIYYLPKSITTYIGKQYEIITLIIFRRLFKDLSNLNLSTDWFKIKYDLQFTYDIIGSVVMFYIIYLFYVESRKRFKNEPVLNNDLNELDKFIKIKKRMATILVPMLLLVAAYSFSSWFMGSISNIEGVSFKNINNIFFDQFFTILIIVDVILLLFSFFYTDQFHKIIRNSGFIVSTILIRLSFSVEGLMNTVLIISATIFGLIMLKIHNNFEKNISIEKAIN